MNINDHVGYRVYETDEGLIALAAISNPYSTFLLTGGCVEVLQLLCQGYSFDDVQRKLLNQFPENSQDVLNDIQQVSHLLNVDLSTCSKRLTSDEQEIYNSNSATGDFSQILKFVRYYRFLTTVTFELNTTCNLRCEHCFHADYNSAGMSAHQIKSLLTNLKDIGVLFLCFTGGEIFLRRDILEILETANNLGFMIEIKTNGTLLNEKYIRRLSTLKRIIEVQVSVYGVENNYSEFTNTNYNFSKVQYNLSLLEGYNIPFSIAYQVTPTNIGTLDSVYSKLSQITNSVFLSYYVTPNLKDPKKNVGSRLTYEQLKNELLPKLQEWNIEPTPSQYRSKDCGNVCWAGHEQIFISAEGVVYPCADLKIPLGTLEDQVLSNIVRMRFDRLAEFMPESIPTCQNCEYHNFCDSCIGVALLENQSLLLPSYHTCDLTRLQFEQNIVEL